MLEVGRVDSGNGLTLDNGNLSQIYMSWIALVSNKMIIEFS